MTAMNKGKCAVCCNPIPESRNKNAKYCSDRCRHKNRAPKTKEQTEKYKALAREKYKLLKDQGLITKPAWLNSEKGKEYRKEYKRKKRREAGVISREESRKLRALIDAEKKKVRTRHRYGDADFHGPPPPRIVLSDADHYYWRYNNNPEFREKEIERSRHRKAAMHDSYLAYLMKMRRKDCTDELLELKREQLKLKRLSLNMKKELNHE